MAIAATAAIRASRFSANLTPALTALTAFRAPPTQAETDERFGVSALADGVRILVMDQSNESGDFGRERISIAKLRDKSAVIELSDAKGQTRIIIAVDATGNPRMEFLDENGKTIYTLPEDRIPGQ